MRKTDPLRFRRRFAMINNLYRVHGVLSEMNARKLFYSASAYRAKVNTHD